MIHNCGVYRWFYSLIAIHCEHYKRRNCGFYLKLRMFVDVLCSLSVQDELGLVGNTDDVVLHGVAQQP